MPVNGKRCLFYLHVFSLYLCFTTGNAVFILNPMNVSTCMGSTAVFTCEVNETVTLSWTINERSSEEFGFYPMNSPLTPGPGYRTQLNVNGTSQLHGASVSCRYIDPLPKSSTKAYLAVQGPPTNLTIIQLNATFYKINWGPQYDFQSLFTYNVVIKNDNEAVVYSKTGIANQSVVSSLDPDPCDRYLATVIAKCQNTSEVYNISTWFTGDQPSPLTMKQITDTFVFEQDNVTMMISQQGVCYFKMEAVSGSDMFLFPHLTPLLSNGDRRITAVSLPSNKLYVVNITAYNVYGHTSSTFNMSTFDIIDIIVSNGSLMCIFNTGSIARGCLLNITDSSSNMTYCRVIERSLNTSHNTPQCSSSCNGPQSTGVYIVEAYDIESDGIISKIPSVRVNLLLLGSSTCTPFPDDSTAAIIGIVLGVVITLCLGICLIIWYKCKHRINSRCCAEPLNLNVVQAPISKKPSARWGHVAVSHKGRLYIWGGCIQQGSSKSDDLMKYVYEFDIESKEWSAKAIESDYPKNCYACAYANNLNKVYIFGGRGIKEKDRYDTLYCLDLNTTRIEHKNSVENITPGRKSGAGMVIWNNQLVLFGGYGYCQETNNFLLDRECNVNGMGWNKDLHVYDLSKNTWRIQSSVATPDPCAYFSFVNLGDSRAVKIGGNDGIDKTNNRVHILDLSLSQMTWSTITVAADGFLGRDMASANLLRFGQSPKCAILILGGWKTDNKVTDEMWIGAEDNDHTRWNFSTLPRKDHRMQRSGHTSSTFVIDPTHIRVVVFGGYKDCSENSKSLLRMLSGTRDDQLQMWSDPFVIDIKNPGANDDPLQWKFSTWHLGGTETHL